MELVHALHDSEAVPTDLDYPHIVWVTRYRRKILNEGVQAYLKLTLAEARKYYPDWYYEAIGMEEDHIHLHMVIPPKYSVSFVIETLKKNTSRQLRERFPFLDQVYWDHGGIWSPGYFVSTVGANEHVIRRYIQMQGREDAGQAKLEFR